MMSFFCAPQLSPLLCQFSIILSLNLYLDYEDFASAKNETITSIPIVVDLLNSVRGFWLRQSAHGVID